MSLKAENKNLKDSILPESFSYCVFTTQEKEYTFSVTWWSGGPQIFLYVQETTKYDTWEDRESPSKRQEQANETQMQKATAQSDWRGEGQSQVLWFSGLLKYLQGSCISRRAFRDFTCWYKENQEPGLAPPFIFHKPCSKPAFPILCVCVSRSRTVDLQRRTERRERGKALVGKKERVTLKTCSCYLPKFKKTEIDWVK